MLSRSICRTRQTRRAIARRIVHVDRSTVRTRVYAVFINVDRSAPFVWPVQLCIRLIKRRYISRRCREIEFDSVARSRVASLRRARRRNSDVRIQRESGAQIESDHRAASFPGIGESARPSCEKKRERSRLRLKRKSSEPSRSSTKIVRFTEKNNRECHDTDNELISRDSGSKWNSRLQCAAR